MLSALSMFERLLLPRWTLLLLVCFLLPEAVAAEPLAEPPVIASSKGSLEVLVIAREQRLVRLPDQPVGWVYEICGYRSSDGPRRGSSGPRLRRTVSQVAEPSPVFPREWSSGFRSPFLVTSSTTVTSWVTRTRG